MSFRIDEPVGISPRVDCVFRVLLADPAHTERLVHFLNAVLQRPSPVVSVVVRSPVQLVDRVQEGQVTVDVIATDASGEMFQVEMQTWNHGAIKERVLYTWAALYKGQLDRGEKYHLLRPVVAIWLMDQNIFRDASSVHHRFRVRDDAGTLELSSHLEVHVIELDRWRSHPEAPIPPALLGWLRFFTEAESWSEVPTEIDNPVLESAMAVLTDFQTNAALNDLYRSRLDFIRTQNTMLADRDDAIAAKEAERAAKEAALASSEAERTEKEVERAAKEAALASSAAERVAKEAALAEVARLAAELAELRTRLGPAKT